MKRRPGQSEASSQPDLTPEGGAIPASRPPVVPSGPTALTITQLVSALRSAVESAVGQVWVKGEVSSFKAYGSGHWYFTLRDEESAVRCVMWKNYNMKVGAPPGDGTEVYALATASVWEERGELRLQVQVMLPTSGIGLQQLARERTRAALEKDGLLDPGRKRPLPEYPRRIAVVTSADGAALRDIITVTRKRWASIELVVVPARVQGEEAADSLVRALGAVNRLDGVDLCIVGRGGGAREDLHAFDEERVCRAVAAVRVPTVSAVGHETDISLTDLVADVRAATPSAAAELAVPDREDVARHLSAIAARLAGGLRRRTGLLALRLSRTGDRMQAAMESRLQEPRARLDRLGGQLDALSPLRVLARGYSVARREDGRVVRRRAELPAGTPFTLRVSDGDVSARAEDR